MKREPIIYFPKDPNAEQAKNIRAGISMCIGKPSKRYYEYIHHSLNYHTLVLKDLEALVKLEGVKVKIVSILSMKNGSKIAVLHRKDGNHFLKNIDKLFADLNKGLASKELNII